MTRTEHDFLGAREVPADAYWGLQALRARENFALSGQPVPAELLHAFGQVKKACCLANAELGHLSPEVAAAIGQAADEVAAGRFDADLALDALQGGAGTSTNMAVNEVIANRALELLGRAKGDYATVHPLGHVNLHQSTNDTYPTALKVAATLLLRELSQAVARLQGACQRKEQEFAEIATVGRTELVEAVPLTLGKEFSGFAEAFARDRWRTFKCEERLRVVNLGGTAVGTGLAAPRSYIFLATEKLREITGLGLSRGENLVDQTANADAFVEVSGMVKALAVNLLKVSADLRLLHLTGEIVLPAVQPGASIMPGKVNPVILESAMQAGMKMTANDGIVAECASRGSLQINEFLPLLGFALIESLRLGARAAEMLARHVDGIRARPEVCAGLLDKSPMVITAFLPLIGYERATELLAEFAAAGRQDFRVFLGEKLGEATVAEVLAPSRLVSLGYHDHGKGA